MTEYEKYQEHIRHTHNAFCRIVIRHAAIDAARSIRSRRSREISLDYLIDEKHYPFSTTDEYFAEQPTSGEYPFTACGQTILLGNPYLAAALSSLPAHTMSQLLPYETIVKASEGDPEAVAAVLSHYAGYIRTYSKMDGHINVEMQEYIVQKLIESLFKFRFDR